MRNSAHVLMNLLLHPLPGALPCSCFAEQGCMDMGGFLPGAVRYYGPRRGRHVHAAGVAVAVSGIAHSSVRTPQASAKPKNAA